GNAPANYGGVIDLGALGGVRFSIRNLTGTISTLDPITLTPAGGGVYNFSSNLAFTLLSPSVLDYAGFGLSGPSVGSGTLSLDSVTAVNAGAAATLTDLGGGNFSLNFPISLLFTETFAGQPAHITLNGAFLALGQLAPVPEPSSLLCVATTGVILALMQ